MLGSKRTGFGQTVIPHFSTNLLMLMFILLEKNLTFLERERERCNVCCIKQVIYIHQIELGIWPIIIHQVVNSSFRNMSVLWG